MYSKFVCYYCWHNSLFFVIFIQVFSITFTVHAGTDARGQFYRPTMMRASPTFAANGSFQILGQINQNLSAASDISTADGGGVSLNMTALTCELPSGSTAGHNGILRANGDADAFFEFISEL